MCVGVVIPKKLHNIGNGLISLPQQAGLYIAAINDRKVNARIQPVFGPFKNGNNYLLNFVQKDY